MAAIEPFKDFELHHAADAATIEKYTNVLPHALINVWKEYGFGTFAKGFMRTINPDEYQELLNETYIKESNPIPIFTTALGDIIVWDDLFTVHGRMHCFETVFYRDGNTCFISPEDNLDGDDLFSEDLTMSDFYKNMLFWGPYMEALKVHRVVPKYDECYGYVPLLGLGGKETVKNLQIVKIKEHIMLIKEMVGPVMPDEGAKG
jgi:hypothetical protein